MTLVAVSSGCSQRARADHADRSDRGDPPHAASRVPAVEEDADEGRQNGDDDEDEPRVVGAEHEREVAGEHREEHRAA